MAQQTYSIYQGTDARDGSTYYQIHNADGLMVWVGEKRETVWYTREDAEAALAAKIADPDADLRAYKRRYGPIGPSCHYCGLPTRNGECDECGTNPF